MSNRPEGQYGPCPFGGLSEVMRWRLTASTDHVRTCRPCQEELLDCGGILPSPKERKRGVALTLLR